MAVTTQRRSSQRWPAASELTIWTDVDGVMSADPNKVPDAQRDQQSFLRRGDAELAYFGAKVIHPQTLGPAVANDIPVIIRNTFQSVRAWQPDFH